MHLNSKLLFQKYAIDYFRAGLRVLEVGPDKFPSSFRELINDSTIAWDTIDLYRSEQLTYTAASEYVFPIPESTYDIVLSGQVLEHVRKPWRWMPELARVCKPGGVVVTVNPVSWPYHEAPIDCWRAYPEGMKALYEEAGLETLVSEWGSLEAPHYRQHLPGRSDAWQSKKMRLVYRVLGALGGPVECAFDTITVGRRKT